MKDQRNQADCICVVYLCVCVYMIGCKDVDDRNTYSLLSTRKDLGDIQLTLQSVFPCSLHIVIENLP